MICVTSRLQLCDATVCVTIVFFSKFFACSAQRSVFYLRHRLVGLLVSFVYHDEIRCIYSTVNSRKFSNNNNNNSNNNNVQTLLDSAMRDLFVKMQDPDYWLHQLLPPVRSTTNSLRERGHNFALYEYNYKFFRQSLW